MNISSDKCLFDTWQEMSAPMFHTSGFWPVFNEAAIQDFLGGEDAGPRASRSLHVAAAKAAKARIDEFLAAVKGLPEGEYACKAAYTEFEEDRLAVLGLILSSDDPEAVRIYNDRLFGKLVDLHQAEALEYFKHYLEHLRPESSVVARAKDQLLGFWRDVPASNSIARLHGSLDSYAAQLKPLVMRKFAFVHELVAPYASSDRLDSVVVSEILRAGIGLTFGRDDTGWSSEVREGVPNVFIDYDQRMIVVPAGRQYAQDHVKSLIIHEVGVHITRSVNGENSRERLAAYGMAGYGPAEEALGALMGSSVKAQRPHIHDFVSLAIADFATRLQPVTFRSVHDLAKALLICIANFGESQATVKQAECARAAFAQTVRMMRLGTGTIVERSTTKYWRGLLLLRSYLDTHGLSEATLEEFLCGKYDCTSKEQLALIKSHSMH